jgi:senataxin
MKCGYPVNVLKMQYRMHPDISSIIGNTFYGGVLQDSPTVSRESYYKVFNPFMFLHVPKSSEVKARRSFKNIV